ncbi:MAG: hypothetical protein F6K56_36170 [Moorea sp. SIO3G5]|nr:hypothetical protein [Moorena sp. SIO3G5]
MWEVWGDGEMGRWTDLSPHPPHPLLNYGYSTRLDITGDIKVHWLNP